jgi:hypothetical protein
MEARMLVDRHPHRQRFRIVCFAHWLFFANGETSLAIQPT